MTPNARTRKYFRKQGYICEIVESYSPFPKPWGKRHDFLTIFDLLLFKPVPDYNPQVWGVQATTTSNMGARVDKIMSSQQWDQWSSMGGFGLVIGWSKKGPRGMVKHWTPKEIILEPTSSLLPREGNSGMVELPLGLPSSVGPRPTGGLG